MKEIAIEWRHYDKGGATCDRCSATGASVREVVGELTPELAAKGIALSLTETLLPEELMAQSNLLLFNGVSLETILEDAVSEENPCPSCSCLTGSDTNCRTVRYQGKNYEEIPAELIRRAVCRLAEFG